jgi:hypothetical protein
LARLAQAKLDLDEAKSACLRAVPSLDDLTALHLAVANLKLALKEA